MGRSLPVVWLRLGQFGGFGFGRLSLKGGGRGKFRRIVKSWTNVWLSVIIRAHVLGCERLYFNENKIERRKTAQGTHLSLFPQPIGRQILMMIGDISGLDFQFYPKLAPERGKIAKAPLSRFGYSQIVKVYVFNKKSLIGEAKCQI
jgi:hypothetical protein